MPNRTLKIAAGLLALLLAACAGEPPPATPEAPSPEEMGRTDQATEELTHLLLELGAALASNPRPPVEKAFAPDFKGRPFPTAAGPASREADWVERRSWTLEGEPGSLSLTAFLESLDAFLQRFSGIESVTFEVPASESPRSGEVTCRVRLAIVARDREGRRVWTQGEGSASGILDRGQSWKIAAFDLESLESMVALRELFTDVTAPAGLTADDLPLVEAIGKLRHWYPNGAAATDVDRDGLVDLFVTGPEHNRLYKNLGDGTFRDVAEAAGLRDLHVEKPEFSPLFFDFDNDGDSDLFLTASYEYLLYENLLVPDGGLFFDDVSYNLPVLWQRQGWSVAAADVDGNGFTDVYVPSYASGFGGPVARTTIWDVSGDENVLFMNQGGGAFTEEGRERGVADRRFGLAAQFVDVDGDFDPDLYLANDYGGGNALFVNEGGRFTDQAEARGVLHAAQSMGVSFGDYDGDGDLDLFVTNMSSTAASRAFHRFDGFPLRHRRHLARTWSGHALFQNHGDGTFDDVSAEAGPFHGDWGWGGGFLDLDNDGWLDLHVPNGFFSGRKPFDARPMVFGVALLATQEDEPGVVEEAMTAAMSTMTEWLLRQGTSFAGWERDRVLLNRGGRFLDVSGISGADSASDGRAAVYADFDNDGDLDVFLRATHGRAHFLFRNDLGQDRGWLRLTLEGRRSARDAFGAVVRIRTPARTLTLAHRAGNGYLAQSDPRLVFGLGEETSVDWIEVRWPSGLVERHPGPFGSGSSLRLVEGEEQTFRVEEKRFVLPGPEEKL